MKESPDFTVFLDAEAWERQGRYPPRRAMLARATSNSCQETSFHHVFRLDRVFPCIFGIPERRSRPRLARSVPSSPPPSRHLSACPSANLGNTCHATTSGRTATFSIWVFFPRGCAPSALRRRSCLVGAHAGSPASRSRHRPRHLGFQTQQHLGLSRDGAITSAAMRCASFHGPTTLPWAGSLLNRRACCERDLNTDAASVTSTQEHGAQVL